MLSDSLMEQAKKWKEYKDEYELSDDDDDYLDDEDEDEEYYDDSGSHLTRNIVIGVLAAALIGLFVINRMFYSGTTEREKTEDTSAMQNSIKGSTDIFERALKENNLVGDGATVAYAIRVLGSNGSPDHIIGISYLDNGDSHAFYKIYDLTQNEGKWVTELVKTEQCDGRKLYFEPIQLRASEDQLPQATEIDGKRYVYFAYFSTPMSSSASGKVVQVLYDVDAKDVKTTSVYSGSFQSLEDGEQYIVVNPRHSGSSIGNYLDNQAQFIGILHIKTEEELAKEREEEEAKNQADTAKTAAETENAAKNWNEQNAGTIENLKAGEQAQVNTKGHDKTAPLFSKENIKLKKQNANFTVFMTNDGKVYVFNKKTQQNSVIYAGGSPATNIGFADTEKGILNVRTASGVVSYDLNTNKVTKQ